VNTSFSSRPSGCVFPCPDLPATAFWDLFAKAESRGQWISNRVTSVPQIPSWRTLGISSILARNRKRLQDVSCVSIAGASVWSTRKPQPTSQGIRTNLPESQSIGRALSGLFGSLNSSEFCSLSRADPFFVGNRSQSKVETGMHRSRMLIPQGNGGDEEEYFIRPR
jgi:hypothetical protein